MKNSVYTSRVTLLAERVRVAHQVMMLRAATQSQESFTQCLGKSQRQSNSWQSHHMEFTAVPYVLATLHSSAASNDRLNCFFTRHIPRSKQ